MADRSIGKFEILGTLGQGAHSKILHVRCQADRKAYALKVVPIESREEHKFLDQARHEYRVAQMLAHPNLVKVEALETQRDWLFRIRKVHLLIEYVNGKTIDQVPRLTTPRLVQAFAEIAAGLVHMHRRGVWHADLKPNNIMLSRAGEVKIIDYGLAWIKGEPKERVQGTPEYMAPEQAKKAIVNDRTDVYNFGATMYRLTAWRLPPCILDPAGTGTISASVFKGLLKPVQEFNATAPPELCDLIHRCLSYNPDKRPERAADVQAELDALAEKLVQAPEDRLDALEW